MAGMSPEETEEYQHALGEAYLRWLNKKTFALVTSPAPAAAPETTLQGTQTDMLGVLGVNTEKPRLVEDYLA